MDLTRLIKHPEIMDKETLYDLRALLALYPYHQTARLLMLQNLYLLHDPSFDEELRRAAIYITDRRVIFNLVEATHYKLKRHPSQKTTQDNTEEKQSRTISLIDNFLDSIPAEDGEKKTHRKPTPADAAVDYVSYLLDIENAEGTTGEEDNDTPPLIGQNLIDNFIYNEGGKIQLKEEPEYLPQIEEPFLDSEHGGEENNDGYFTETLAKIYIKQGRYSKALEIIKRLNLNYPKKNAYFADQIRFLEKLILNNKNNK